MQDLFSGKLTDCHVLLQVLRYGALQRWGFVSGKIK
jgi:hypothetical protein